jgi:serine/threonine-protein kinase
VVYLARDPLIERKVALKTLRIDRHSRDVGERKSMFLREARAAGQLSHPGIVSVYEVGEDTEQDLVFIALEYVGGRALERLIAGGRPLAVDRALGVVRQVAEALDYAHFRGVVHRDVKPANIMVTPSGAAKITDFGIAKVDLFDRTFGGKTVGTPNYMSPEQVRGQAVDERSDLYALGLVLFEVVTGERPFRAATILELCDQIVERPAPSLARRCPHLPAELDRIVATCLAKNPDHRYQTCGELLDALRAAGGELRGG